MVFIVLVQTFAGIAAFALLKRLTSERAAILGAACYAMNPYALLMIYIRSDFAEQLASALFPLVLLGALRFCNYLEDSEPRIVRNRLFCDRFCGSMAHNAPAGSDCELFVGAAVWVAALTQRSLKLAVAWRVWPGARIRSDRILLIPAAYEQRWVNIAQALSTGLLPWQNFLFTAIEDPEHTLVNWIASSCALMLILLLGFSALLSRRLAEGETRCISRNMWTGLLVVGTVATLLMLRFTFRWGITAETAVCSVSVEMDVLRSANLRVLCCAVFERRRGWLFFVVVAVASVPLGHFLVSNGWWDTDEMPTQYAAIERGTGFDGTDEYDPLGDDHSDLPMECIISEDSAETKDSRCLRPRRRRR